MTRRRTSVIGPGRADAFAHPSPAALSSAQPDAQTVWRWSLAAARELSLSLEGDQVAEAQRFAQAKRYWEIAHGRVQGNPEESAGRSEVKRIQRGGDAFWCKHFENKDLAWQLNESGALSYLGSVDRNTHLGTHLGLRDHVAWMRSFSVADNASSLQIVETYDAGPNLRAWQQFAPCSHLCGFAYPLFAQATFLAALARQMLIGLEKLATVEVVHNDIKPNNLCLAIPKNCKLQRRVWQTHIDLQRPKLRFIDFELAFVPQRDRLVQTHDHAWVSPFAKRCHAKAAVSDLHEEDRGAILSAIDWGSDLWSLGHLVEEWIDDAVRFMDAWLNAVRETFGDNSPVCARAVQVAGEQADALQPLQELSLRLKEQDRPLSDAGEPRLPKRTPTHAALRAHLESAYPLLTSGRNSKVVMHWIDPHALLHAPPARRWVRAISRGAQDLSGWWRLHRKKAAAAVGALAMGGGLWIKAPELKAWTLDQIENGSYLTANAWLDSGGAVNREVLQLLLYAPTNSVRDAAQAGLLRSVQKTSPPSAERIKAFVAYANQGMPGNTQPAVDAEIAEQRLATLRALVIWHWSGAVLEQTAFTEDVLGHLQALYTVQNQLEKVSAAQLAAPTVQELWREVRSLFTAVGQRWPLARLMSIRLEACYEDAPLLPQLQQDVRSLLAIPASAEGASVYRGYAQAVQDRLDEGISPCLIPPAPRPTSH